MVAEEVVADLLVQPPVVMEVEVLEDIIVLEEMAYPKQEAAAEVEKRG